MVVRLLALLAVTGIACSAAVAAGAHGGRAGAALPRIPALPAKNPAHHGARCPIPPRFRSAFVHAARDTGFQLSMLVAVAQVESRFKPDARSQADARGLLQVLPSTAAWLKLDVDNPVTNVLAGARYLKILLDRYARTDLALAAYNAGPTAVDEAGGAPSAETMSYVANVQQRWAALAGCS
ncbi:MAG TPA: lytic transglycosylase domain-containing protein [Gaiellaceae bacterium]|jgi:soluble lytic murein transglycosylase-like protein|nr:lytic transglycosylase domain-containing protein [Gaiellaceae bacterium]